MKAYKNKIVYEIECVTSDKPNKEAIERIKHNIEINLSVYNTINSGGKITIESKELDL